MRYLTRRKLRKAIDEERVRNAIEEAETRTSGEIRLSLSTFFIGNVRRTAERAFSRLRMDRTRERNGILFFIVPSRHRIVILGDEGIYRKAGQDFWDRLVKVVSGKFLEKDYTEGLVDGIKSAGEMLAEFFPFQPGSDVNELPDDIDFQDK